MRVAVYIAAAIQILAMCAIGGVLPAWLDQLSLVGLGFVYLGFASYFVGSV